MSFCLTWLLIYPLYIFIKERRGYFKIYLQISLISVLMHFYHDNFREYVFSRTRVLHAKSFLFFILKINTNPGFFCFCLCRFSPDFLLYGDVTITGEALQICWPMLGTYGLWVVRVLERVTATVTLGICL